jgi:hypothetical protein
VGVAGSPSQRCVCGSALLQFWIWPDEDRDDLIHVTDRWRDVPKNGEAIRAVSATDAAVAYDRKHEPEHDVYGPMGQLRKGRCARRLGLRK